MAAKVHNIYKLIQAAGGMRKLAIRLGMDPTKGADCIAHWKKRGIPRSLKIAYAGRFDRILLEATKGNKNPPDLSLP